VVTHALSLRRFIFSYHRRKEIIFLNIINGNGLGKRKQTGKINGLVTINTVLKA
jgi:hypothetical protein